MWYCDNPVIDTPNNNHNYNFYWNSQTLTRLTEKLNYPCKSNHRVESNVDWKSDAAQGTDVTCGSDGYYVYPTSWPQCSESVNCPDPGNSAEVTRTLEEGNSLQYDSILRYTCDDNRKWIKLVGSSSLSPYLDTRCQWRQTFPLDGTKLQCEIHHCRHPHNDPGSHSPPGAEYDIVLVDRSNWTIPFGVSIVYECAPNTHIENNEISPSQTSLSVECLANLGVYDTPVRQGGNWPNCTETVVCGQPPELPVNVTRVWLSPALDLQETYDTYVTYSCPDGSQFDINDDGVGDNVTVTLRCQWNKQWAPYHSSLPPCVVTHCVETFKIPPETSLDRITDDWTPINTYKEYRCLNQDGDTPTMFWESDRTRSTFQLMCKDDGYFTWEEWPICLTDITCDPAAPEVPTHSEYTDSQDDGTVTINSLQYPVVPSEVRTTNLVLKSEYNSSFIPRNYMANLTYYCGSARKFLDADGNHKPTQSMTCQWDKSWTPTPTLDPCDWVACLKPPTPPKSTHLRVSDWFGDPIPFGDQIRFVCDRGYFFEEDPAQVDVKYTCQDGKSEGFEEKRGFFDVPDLEADWPRCLLAPLCPKPPDVKEEGVKEYMPIPIGMEPEKLCALDSEDLTIQCPTFLKIFINAVSYGRNSSLGKDLCDGEKPKDNKAPAMNCYEDDIHASMLSDFQAACHHNFNCTVSVATVPLDPVCDGMRREARIEYICGNYSSVFNSALL